MLLDAFGPWIPSLFGEGAILLLSGPLLREMVAATSLRRLGKGAASVGWRPKLLAVAR